MSFHNLIVRGLAIAFMLGAGAEAFADRTTTYLHADGLGSVVAATNTAGVVVWRKSYVPFGEQIDATLGNANTAYTGKPHDEVVGLTYFGARHFDPEIGRFSSVDPIGFTEWNPISFNAYAYANNNPYRFVDPDGRQSQDASCDEVCEYERQRSRAAYGARAVSQGASDVADVLDGEASSAWNWIPFARPLKKVVPGAKVLDEIHPRAIPWNKYPTWAPKPKGIPRVISGAEYEAARKAADNANAALRRANPAAYAGKQIHEILPVKFGGSPTDPRNKIAVSRSEHTQLTNFWNNLLREMQ